MQKTSTGSAESVVARNIRALLGARRITITELSKYLGMTRATLSSKLNSPGAFKMGEIIALAEFFGYLPSEIVDDSFSLHQQAA